MKTAMPQRATTLSKRQAISRELSMNKYLYIMAMPVVAYFVIFHYVPLYGAMIAFKQFDIGLGIWGSKWIGFDNFITFFRSIYFVRLIKNTVLINLYSLIFEFPTPLIFALLLNELRSKRYKSFVQTASYLPHFISTVVVCGMILDFCSSDGIITSLVSYIGSHKGGLMINPAYFRSIYIISGIWQGTGWGSIIYLSYLSGIDAELYEAATIDGAGRFKQLIFITIPGLVPIIMVLLIMRIGRLLSVGYEKIMLLYNYNTLEVADVISTYVYRKGLLEGSNFSYTSAVGLFNSCINLLLLISANKLSKKFTDKGLL